LLVLVIACLLLAVGMTSCKQEGAKFSKANGSAEQEVSFGGGEGEEGASAAASESGASGSEAPAAAPTEAAESAPEARGPVITKGDSSKKAMEGSFGAADSVAASAEAGGLGLSGTGRGGGGAAKAAGIGSIGSKGGSAPAKPRRARRKAKRSVDSDKRAEVEAKIRDAVEAEEKKKEKEKVQRVPPRAGQLTAGEWRDLDHWSFWRELMGEGKQDNSNSKWAKFADKWGFDTGHRFSVLVGGKSGRVADAKVRLVDAREKVLWEARTDNQGRAELFAGFFGGDTGKAPYQILVEKDGRAVDVDAEKAYGARPYRVEMPQATKLSRAVDVMFVVDTTGSMGDELSYLKRELQDVAQRVQKKSEQRLAMRLSVNFYRDKNDDYLVRSYPFSSNVSKVNRQIASQNSGGGGDFPEAVDEALEDAVFEHEWRDDARARLLFLVLDAPPHGDAAGKKRLHRTIREAAKRGIRVIPVAGSGIDKNTEFLMRHLAIGTGGTYAFLTDDSGIGGSHIKPTIGPHDVEYLNDMLVRLILEASR
jgi:hypothetical protein